MIAKASQISQNYEQLRNIEKHEKHQETSYMTEFSTLKMNFRFADAANHVNRDAQHILEVTRRAYIPKI